MVGVPFADGLILLERNWESGRQIGKGDTYEAMQLLKHGDRRLVLFSWRCRA